MRCGLYYPLRLAVLRLNRSGNDAEPRTHFLDPILDHV
jgi:hypothetical protein